MIGLTTLELYNSIFIITEERKLEFFTDTFIEFSFAEIKDKLEEILGLSDVSLN